ncbi:MAG: Sec-independent protein translocase subunit TatA/TatB [Thermoleophilaceae bacterium]|jgi:sec-independent protein translocase protein TatA
MSTIVSVLGSVGPLEIVIVLVIALLVLGPKRLPEVGKSVGRGLREFKSAVSGGGDSTSARLDRLGGDDDEEHDLFADERQAEERRRFEEQQAAEETTARERL